MGLLYMLLLASTFISLSLSNNEVKADKPYNVLFVVADDLRPELGGHYQNSDLVYTPNFEAFMDRSFTFTHTYV